MDKTKVYVIRENYTDSWSYSKFSKIVGIVHSITDARYKVSELNKSGMYTYDFVVAESMSVDKSTKQYKKFVSERLVEIDKDIEDTKKNEAGSISLRNKLEEEKSFYLSETK